MQCNALPQPWATLDRSRSMSDNVQFHSSSGRFKRPQAPAMATWSHHELIGSEELAARQHSACHAGPSGRVNNLLNRNFLQQCSFNLGIMGACGAWASQAL